MRARATVTRLLALANVVGIFALLGITQAAEPAVPQTNLTLERGAVLEVVAEHSIPDPQYGWVLSLDGQFQEAERTSFYRTRLIEAGTYKLNAELSSKDGTTRMRSIIKITVPAIDQRSTTAPQAGSSDIVRTNPSADSKGRVIISSTKNVVLFEPVDRTRVPLTLDLSDSRDSNRDGNALNDNDVAGTFFATRGTPLLVWFTDSSSPQTLTVSAGSQTQSIRTTDQRSAQQEDALERQRVAIAAEQTGSGAVAFSLDFPRGAPTYPLLLTWDFGDGGTSLLDAPSHTYGRNDTFTVKVEVRNLTNGEVTEEASQSITITDADVTPPTDTGPPEEEKSGLMGLILKILLVLFGAIVVGVVVVVIIAVVKKAASPKEKTKEEAITLEEEEEEGTKTLPPMEIEATEVEEVEELKEEKEVKKEVKEVPFDLAPFDSAQGKQGKKDEKPIEPPAKPPSPEPASPEPRRGEPEPENDSPDTPSTS